MTMKAFIRLATYSLLTFFTLHNHTLLAQNETSYIRYTPTANKNPQNSDLFKTMYANSKGTLTIPNNTEQKPIYAYVYSETCSGCRHMEKYVYAEDRIAQALKTDFIPIKLNGEETQNKNFKSYYNIIQYPTLLFLDPNTNKVLVRVDHAVSAEEMNEKIQQAKQKIQKNIAYTTPTLKYPTLIDPTPNIEPQHTKTFTPLNFPPPTTNENTNQQQSKIALINTTPTSAPPPVVVAQPKEKNTPPLGNYSGVMEKKETEAQLQMLNQKYAEGNRSPEFLRTYAYALRSSNANYNKPVNEYLKLPKNKKNAELDREFVYDFATNLSNEAIYVFAQNAKDYKKYYSGSQINQKIKSAINAGVTAGAAVRDISVLDKAKKVAQTAQLPDIDFLTFETNLLYFGIVQDWKMYAQIAYNYLKTDIEPLSGNPQTLNEIAANIAKCSDCNKKDFKFALKLAQYSNKIENEYYNNITCSEIYLILSNPKKAVRHANIANLIAQERGISNKSAQNIIQKLEKQ